MNILITQAINERRQLQAILDGRRRITVEPYALGVTAACQDALLYRLEHLSSLQMIENKFNFPTAGQHMLQGRLHEITAMV